MNWKIILGVNIWNSQQAIIMKKSAQISFAIIRQLEKLLKMNAIRMHLILLQI